ncbi:hypothetical protein AVEN_84217-1 [Araneus ventricosus]|uniref:Uncharacterized protein n=1 Tax=Araneus ventricosus TaxID=182803 RepID=A0A4Y2L1C1_ARAVE|nr:hypothetical protein AVEN_84217-1 [Araneus ventricosus]
MFVKIATLLRNCVRVVLETIHLRNVPGTRPSVDAVVTLMLGTRMDRGFRFIIQPSQKNARFICVSVRLCVQIPSMSLSGSSLFSWRFFQGNLGRSQVATQELPNLCFPFVPDIYLLQEPYLVFKETLLA